MSGARVRPQLLEAIALAALIAAAAAFFAFQALSRYYTFHNRTFDLALYARWAWGLSRGDFWNPVLDQSFIASHWAFVLAPLGWLGRVFGTVETLLLAQSVALAVTAWPLARFAARRGSHLGPIAAALYLLYPNLCHVASYEFHPGNLALPAIAFGIDAIDRRSAGRLLASGLWVLLCRADFALATAALGALGMWLASGASDGDRGAFWRSARGLLLGSLGYLVLVQAARALFAPALPSADLHFGPWGGSPLGVLPALLSRPSQVFAHFFALERLTYPVRVLLPLACLPLLAPRYAVVGLPFLLLNLISVFPTSQQLYSHYLTPAVPALVAAAIEGLGRLAPPASRLASVLLVLAAGAASLIQGGAPWSRDYVARDFRMTQQSWSAGWAMQAVPPDASVQAPDLLLPHLAERAVVHRGPRPERGTDIVVLDARPRLRFVGQETLLRTSEEPHLRTWLARVDHAVIDATPALITLARQRGPRSAFARRFFASGTAPAQATPLCRCLAVARAHLSFDHHLGLRAIVTGRCPSDLALRMGVAARPKHVRLMFDGYFSPVHLQPGEMVDLDYPLPRGLATAIAARGAVRLGALRTSGAPPEPGDPVSVELPVVR